MGDEPSAIASGPAAPDVTTLDDATSVLRRYRIEPPESISRHLEGAEETPGPEHPVFEGVENVVVGSGRHACEAAWRRPGNSGTSRSCSRRA